MLAVSSSSLFVPRKRDNNNWIIFLVVSILLHIGLTVFLHGQVKISAEPFDKKTPPPKALDTYLVIAPKLKVVPEPEVKPEPEIQQQEQTPPQALPQTEEQAPAESVPVEVEPKSKPFVANEVVDAKPPARQENSKSILSYQGLDTATSNYFDRLNSISLDDLALEEARDYYLNKDTVVLPKSGRFAAANRSGPGNPSSVQVDCTSSVKKGLAALSMLTGGRVSCYSAGNIQPFIDARLNKTTNEKNTR